MEDKLFELLTNLYTELNEFKAQVSEKMDAMENKQNVILEEIQSNLLDLAKMQHDNFIENKHQQEQIVEDLSEKIAMLLLRKF